MAAAQMPTKCLELRTKLQIEYCRMLDWAEVAGLVDYEYGADLPEILRTDKLVLIAILTQIQSLMNEFADLNGRYKQLRPDEAENERIQNDDTNIAVQFASISIKYEKNAVKRKHPKGTNHILSMVKDAKEVAMEPKRLWWVAFDEDVFKTLLRKLTEHNDYLHELMHGHHARQLEETTRNTYLELVQVRSSIDELRNLMTAVLVLGDRSAERSSINAAQGRNEQMLQSLAKCKGLSLANDAADDEKPPTYHEATTKTNIAYSAISYNEISADPETATGRVRVAGTYTTNDKDIPVWIEWKTYRVELNRDSLRRYPLPENVTRVRELVGLLQQSQMSEFRIPRCAGFFDDRDDKDDSNHPDRFGIVFEKPDPSPDAPGPLSLLDAIIRLPCPSLSVRVVLAHKVANSLLYLHAVKWLHKSLRSDGIIFFPEPHSQEPNLAEPFLSGFEYARPDRDGIGSTGAPQDPLAELYVHPSYQGADAVGTYRKTFDIYSLGIVLLEIMYWQRIQNIMALPDSARPRPRELKAIRARLLQDGAPYLGSLKASVGDKIHTAVKSCIEGLTAFELLEGDNEMDGVVGATLQRNFTRRVVNNLRDVVL
ncbi:hypothetical protein MMC18_007868 [Xylographa bjoerkii]|nr:hypothetical protein [Xylographa bjoerkii]